MDISYQFGDAAGDSGERRLTSITIHLAPAEDPDGHLVGLVQRERLAGALTAYARPLDYGTAGMSRAEFTVALARVAFVANMLDRRREGMELAARDMHRIGWGTIADAVEAPRSTVRDRITETREVYAEHGAWWDASGVHLGSPAEARAAIGNTAPDSAS
jgi:hypothetical protein